MLEVLLTTGLPGGRIACLRELCGRDEQLVQNTSSTTAASLLGQLLVARPGAAVLSTQLPDLAVCDRDRLLAAVHRNAFGDRIETHAPCHGCGVSFEVSFSLAALEASLAPEATLPDSDGVYRLADDRRFRLPTLADEQAIAGFAPDLAAHTLASRCLLDGPPGDTSEVLAAIERVGPLIDVEVDSTCPECQVHQRVHFDIQSFLLSSLLRDRPGLTLEIHRIASAYSWTLGEILDLPRSQRRMYVALIEAERSARRTRV